MSERENDWIDQAAQEAAAKLAASSRCGQGRKKHGNYSLPSSSAVHAVVDSILGVLFPGCHGNEFKGNGNSAERISSALKAILRTLNEQVLTAFKYQCDREECIHCCGCEEKTRAALEHFIKELPATRELLQLDIQSAYEGDPAAKSTMEVVMSYPAINAIATYRTAHLLYEKGVPLIPRIMTELAHSRTGIDIHPGASIGPSFFIDHGTGVVIGETAVIGKNVKIYQGVTLGALSFPKDEHGKLIKGIKRHPEVRDNVTIYAEATLLGGDTVVGEGSEIGGNVWLTHSVPPHSKVRNVEPEPRIVPGKRPDSRGKDQG